jgi:hypothetical protein
MGWTATVRSPVIECRHFWAFSRCKELRPFFGMRDCKKVDAKICFSAANLDDGVERDGSRTFLYSSQSGK